MNLLPYFALGAAAGYVYEKISSYLDAKAHPPPGELIDVEGYHLHVHIQGEAREGIPSVIIETGIFDCSHSWQLVQPKIAAFTQVCSYDRAGYGWSDPKPCPRSFQEILKELKALIEIKKLKPPFIFIGHSLGGPLVRYYHSQYPQAIAGIIFVDALHDTIPKMPRLFMIAARAFSYLSVIGIPRLLSKPVRPVSKHPEWTKPLQKTYITHFVKPSSLRTCFAENDAMPESFLALQKEKKSLHAIPVTFISRDPALPQRPFLSEQEVTEERKALEQLHAAQGRDVVHGNWVLVKGSNHFIQLDKPELIVNETRKMIESICSR